MDAKIEAIVAQAKYEEARAYEEYQRLDGVAALVQNNPMFMQTIGRLKCYAYVLDLFGVDRVFLKWVFYL